MKTKIGKRILTGMLSGVLLTASLVGCGSSPATNGGGSKAAANGAETSEAKTPEQKQFVIGIAEAQFNDEVTTRRSYLENYIAPNYNVKFIFSEQCDDDAATKAFIENCIDSGADAIIDFKSTSPQLAQLCKDNGLIYTVNGTPAAAPGLYVDMFDNFTGFVGGNNQQVASLYGDWLRENVSDDGSEGFLIATGLASAGNVQHAEITRAILEGLRDKYGLKYDMSIEDLVATANTLDATNDKGIMVTLYPGAPNKETWLPGVSSLIQTGNYGVILSAGQTYNQTATVVNEVEASLGMNIKVGSIGAFGSTLSTAFHTMDPNGEPSVDLIVVKPVSVLTATLFAITYNGLLGKTDQSSRDADGMPSNFRFSMISVTRPEQLEAMEGWDDRDSQNWIANTDVVDCLLVLNNPELTAEDIQAFLVTLNQDTISALMK